jgi:hypothetical protein
MRGPVLVALLVGCAAEPKDGTSTGLDTDADTDTDTDVDTDTAAAERPVITTADAWCYFHDTGDQFWNWDAACEVTDPQGARSLDTGALVVLRDGAEVHSGVLACNRDTGRCTTTFREDATGVMCADATSYQFRFTVTDEDGYVSDPVEIAGRAQ